MTDLAALTALFPPPSRDAWLKLVDKTLKGGSLESLGQPLYTEAEPVAVAKAPGLDPKRPWQLRVIADHPDAATANRLLLEDLRGGAASVLLKIGAEGVALTGPADMDVLLDGVMIELAPVALDAGFAGPQAANALAAAARRSPRALLAFHLDPLSAFAETGASPGPIEAHLAAAGAAAVRHAEAYPLASLFLATGRTVHEAGGSDVQELAFMAAAAVAYLRALTDAGMPADKALQRIALGVSVDGEFLTGVAKLRAARLIWDQLAGALGVDAPAAIEARASRRMLSKADLWTNLLRLTAANFAGAVGGADAIVLEPFTQPLGMANDQARRQARNIQLVLMEEAFLGRVEDPARGSWFLDARSKGLARDAWAAFQAIEASGGLSAVLKDGSLAQAVNDEHHAQQARYTSGEAKLLGVNLYPNKADNPPTLQARPPAPADSLGDPRQSGADDACAPLVARPWSAAFEVEAPR